MYFILFIPFLKFYNKFPYRNNKFLYLKNNIINLINNDKILNHNCNIYYESRIKTENKILYKIKKNKIPIDIYGLRIIYSLNDDKKNNDYAYYIQNIIENKYFTLNYFYDDYIKYPKKNNYQGIHMYIYNEILMEIQIRDIEMHYNAVNGTASNYY